MIDVLGLLVVLCQRGALVEAATDPGRGTGNREEGQPARGVEQRRTEQNPRSVLDHERERVDAGAAVGHAGGEERPTGRYAPRQQLEPRRRHVVDPGTEQVAPGERPAGEDVAARIHGDVIALLAWEDGARNPDVEAVVAGQHVCVHRRAGVSLDVVLVARTQEPRLDQCPVRDTDDRSPDVGERLVDVDVVELLAAALVHLGPGVGRRRSERAGREAVLADVRRARASVTGLELLQRQDRPDLGPWALDREVVGNPPHVGAAFQRDEAVVVAGCGVRVGPDDDGNLSGPTGRHGGGRR